MNQNWNFAYSILSWNVRGLGQDKKCAACRDTISISHPHIVCLQETKLQHLDARKSKSFLPSHISEFAFVPADGSRGGMLTAWDPRVATAGSPAQTPYSLSVPFSSTSSSHSFTVTNIYAPADHRETPAFLADLLTLAHNHSGSWLVIGDFNLTRAPKDKNNPNFDTRLAQAFNDAIDTLALFEIPLLDRLYTWSNKRETPTLARLDRAFVNNGFASLFPNTSLSSHLGLPSDHIPLTLTAPTSIPKSSRFRFENAWLKHPTFLAFVLPGWSGVFVPQDAAGALVGRIKALRRDAKAWSRQHRARPADLNNASFIVLLLDMYEEYRVLTSAERRLRDACRERVTLLVAQRAAY